MRTLANVVHTPGPPSNFSYEEIEIADPTPGEVLIEHHAIGVNFIDTYFRKGLYPWPGQLPIIVGAEGSGQVVRTGKEVKDLQVGDRVAYTVPTGAYCKHRTVPDHRVVKLPEAIPYELAAGVMLKGLTAHYLLHGTYPVGPGTTVLYHAAAGGVGLIAGQWASHLGAVVIGTVSTEEKALLARANGYHHVINYKEESFVEKVMDLTGGNGVDVVYDSVGRSTYPDSLKCLKRRGMWVCFGQSSGTIENFDLRHLVQHGSLFATRPTLFDYIPTKESLQTASQSLFQVMAEGHVKGQVKQKFPLKDAGKVHTLLETRKTSGSTILVP